MGIGVVFSLFWLVGLVLAAMAALKAYGCGRRLWEGRRSRDWPYVDGVVLHASVRRERIWQGGMSPSRLIYIPEVTYTYEVAGRAYDGDAMAVRRVESALRAVIERIVDEHPVGAPVRVHHHPDRPERAVLRTGPMPNDMGDLLGAALGVAVGAGLMAWSAAMGGGPIAALALVRGLLPFVP